MSPIKLGVAGTHSTGKSTLLSCLAKSLADKGLRVKQVADLASDARKVGFPILHNHTFESTLWIMTRGISCELEACLDADVVLVDRPVMDALAYLFAALVHRQDKVSQNQSEYLLDLARHHAKTYTVICKTTLDPSIPLGPGRDTDMAFRNSVASQLDGVFSKLSLSPRIVEHGPEFVNLLIATIEAHFRNRKNCPT